MNAYEKAGSLSAAFAQADNRIKWGGYEIEKQPDEPWQRARFSMSGKEISLHPRSAMLMALLIAHEGAAVTLDIIADEFTKPCNGGIKRAVHMSEEQVYNNLRVHVFKTRRALAQAFDRGNNAGAVIENINPSRSTGEQGQYYHGYKGALRLSQE